MTCFETPSTQIQAKVKFLQLLDCHFLRVKIIRSSHRRCSVRKGVFRNSAKFTGKLCQSLSSNFFKKETGTGVLR